MDRKDYLDTRKLYNDIRSNQSNLLDNSMLAVAASSLGLLVAFNEKIVPLKEALWLPVLILSIVALGISTAATVFSFYSSYKAACDFQTQLDANQASDSDKPLESIWDLMVDVLNGISIVTFIIGLGAAIAYIAINFINRGGLL